ncbi:MAG: hypothetical protein KDH94_08490, partial [Coxiellaceae bacterium]|nr:hypothetical protein [Coxiellaceae bacterium]
VIIQRMSGYQTHLRNTLPVDQTSKKHQIISAKLAVIDRLLVNIGNENKRAELRLAEFEQDLLQHQQLLSAHTDPQWQRIMMLVGVILSSVVAGAGIIGALAYSKRTTDNYRFWESRGQRLLDNIQHDISVMKLQR